MRVTAWKGGGYGIRVGKANAGMFPRMWKTIDVTMGGHTHTFNLTRTFWTTCPEFRGKEVQKWLRVRRSTSWPYRNPPTFSLTRIRGQHFRLH